MQTNSRGNGCSSKVNRNRNGASFTDDDLQQIDGSYDKFVGKLQERYGDKKSDLMKWPDAWYQKTPKAEEKK